MTSKLPIRGPEADARWRDHIDRYRASGLSKVEYCRKHGMSDHALDYWLKKFKDARHTQQPASFVRVDIPPVARARGLRLSLPGGVTVDVADDFDVAQVAKLIVAIGGRK